ncbi:MAG: hypothetical protein H7X80_08930, partial [bacterium]|nr:hypothetical protein [Candidatus Kapabacteria bacterium]
MAKRSISAAKRRTNNAKAKAKAAANKKAPTKTQRRSSKAAPPASVKSAATTKRAQTASGAATNGTAKKSRVNVDWERVARLMLLSRAIDQIEEERLVPAGLVTYQFSSRGHDLAQVLLALAMQNPHDAAAVYY